MNFLKKQENPYCSPNNRLNNSCIKITGAVRGIAPFVCSIPSNRWGYDIGGIPQVGVPLFWCLIFKRKGYEGE